MGSWVTITTLRKLKHKSLNRLGIKMVEKISKQYFEHKNYLDTQMEIISTKIAEIMTKNSADSKMPVSQSEFISLVRTMESLTENGELEDEQSMLEELTKLGLEMKIEVDRQTGEEILVVDEVDCFEGFEEIN